MSRRTNRIAKHRRARRAERADRPSFSKVAAWEQMLSFYDDSFELPGKSSSENDVGDEDCEPVPASRREFMYA